MKNLLFLLPLIFVSQISNAQSPWTKNKGEAYVQIGLTSLAYSDIADKDGKTKPTGDVTDVTVQAYSEYGITDKLTANLVLPFKSIAVSDDAVNISESQSGLGNVSLGLKYKLSDGDWKISTGIQYTTKTISKNKDNSLASGFNASTILPYISIGSSKNKWYYYGNVGYGYMDNDYADFFRFNGEVGYNIIPKGHIIFAVETKNNLSKEDLSFNDEFSNFSTSNRQNYNAFGLKLNYEFSKDKFGANFAAFGAADIKNAPLAPTLNIGFYAKL